MDSYQILTIIISVLLIIILVTIVITAILVIKVLRSIKHMIDKAESMVDNVSHVGSFFRDTTATKAAISLISNIISLTRSERKRPK